MPQFMDFHDDLQLTPAEFEQLRRDATDKVYDEFGVRQVDLYHDHGGHAYCLLDAPDAEAVRRHHAAIGLPCGDVHQVDTLR